MLMQVVALAHHSERKSTLLERFATARGTPWTAHVLFRVKCSRRAAYGLKRAAYKEAIGLLLMNTV